MAYRLIVLGTLKWNCDIKTSKTLSCLHLKYTSVTIRLNSLLDSISAIISSDIIIKRTWFSKESSSYSMEQLKIEKKKTICSCLRTN